MREHVEKNKRTTPTVNNPGRQDIAGINRARRARAHRAISVAAVQ